MPPITALVTFRCANPACGRRLPASQQYVPEQCLPSWAGLLWPPVCSAVCLAAANQAEQAQERSLRLHQLVCTERRCWLCAQGGKA